MTESRPRVAVVTFPGSNDDRDALHALDLLGAEAVPVWHADHALPEVGAVVLPGGFSYEFARGGGPVLGICNGFQILCEAGLLPGTLRPNSSLSFVCHDVDLRVERTDSPIMSLCEPGQALNIPVKHGEGCWFADDQLVAELEANGQIVLRYEDNPNGSVSDVAGVVSAERNVMGLMPHPEHAVDRLLGSADGALILRGLIAAARDRTVIAA